MSRFKAVLLFCLLAAAYPAFAQISSSTGAIQGTVMDPQGAVVPNAKVTLVNMGTGSRQEGKTQDDGTYVFALITPGKYRVEVEATGFRRVVMSDLLVEVTRTTVANARMEVGEVTSELVVTDAALLVDTTNATTGDVITGDLVKTIPLPTRNFLDLTSLQAGVAAPMTNPAALGRGAPQLFVAGQRGTVNNFVLNGVDANNFSSNNFANVAVPNPDAIQEFRVQTSQFDATQGRGSGGNINVAIRSGQKDLHGNAFWFYRSDALNANDWFFNRSGTARPVLLQNQFGGTLGGPVWGLDETFWFFSYQGMRQKNGVAGAISGSHPVMPATRDANSLAAAFGLTPAQIDPVSVALLNLPGPYGGLAFPSGNCAGINGCTGVGSIGQFTASSPSIFNEDQFSGSFDRELFRNNRFSFRVFRADADQNNPFGGGVTLGLGQTNPFENINVAVGDTHVFGPTLTNEFHVGYTLARTAAIPVEAQLSDVGMTRFNQSQFTGLPGIFFGGSALSFAGINTNNDQASAALSVTLSDTVSWTFGKHTLRMGGEFRRYHVNTFNNFASRGALVYISTGGFSDFQNFLRGAPFQTFAGTGITNRAFRAYDVSGYVQDDYRFLPRLTFNLGLRYDILAPSSDTRDRLGNFDPSLLSAACLQTGGNCLRDGFVSPEGLGGGFGTPGVSKSTLLGNDLNNWGPRVGMAWDVLGDGRLAVRSGYGVYFIRTSNQTLLQLITAAPFFQLSNLVGTPAGALANANPFPALPTADQFPILPVFPQFNGFSAAGAPLFINPATGGSAALLTINPFERNLRTPYNQNWNLTVQYEFLKGWVVEMGYIGARAVKLLGSRQMNSARLVDATNPGLGGLVVNSSTNATARVMVPGFSTNGLLAVTGEGQSWFNAGILSVRHNFSKGFMIKADYTLAKSLDNNSGAAAQDLGGSGGNQLVLDLNKGLSLFDQKHRMVFTYVWDIPGPKQGWMGQVAGGWQVSGVTIFQSGFPFTIVDNTGGSLQGVTGGTSRAMPVCLGGQTAGGNISNSVNNFVNPACFTATPVLPTGTVLTNVRNDLAPGTGSFVIGNQGPGGVLLTTGTGSVFGTLGRNTLRTPFQQRFDFAVTKRFPLPMLYNTLGEQSNLEFRAEFFKLFNTPIFGNAAAVNANISNLATFGRITGTVDGTGRVIQFALKMNF